MPLADWLCYSLLLCKYTPVSTKVFPRKCRRQYRLALWVVRVWFCLIEVQGDSATRNEKKQIHVFAVSFHHAETP